MFFSNNVNSDLLVYWRLQLVRQAQDTAYKLVKTNHMRAIDILGFGTWSTQSARIDGVHEDYNYIRIHVCLFFFFFCGVPSPDNPCMEYNGIYL